MAIKAMTVADLRLMLSRLKKDGLVTDQTLVELSCDEEGNHYAPLAQIDGAYNVGIEDDKSKLTLYPL
jgi:hypothetical protein